MGRIEDARIRRASPEEEGIDRRDFLKVCTIAAAAVGLPASVGKTWAQEAKAGLKPSVIWLHFQECTGCTETLLRTSHPDIGELILDLISLDYHETLFAAAGHQIEKALHDAMEKHAGGYICVVEGAIPTKDNGIYCKIAGRTAMDIMTDVGSKAAAVIAIGSCASWGGLPSADPNPTGAVGAGQILKDAGINKPVVNLPGCPSNPYNFLGTALQFVALGSLPALDALGRPMFAYGRTIHEHCPRRAHFDAGNFAHQYGDEGHRLGYCLYPLGCKGPETHANCPTNTFGEVGVWPIGIGHPCFGCTEQGVAFHKPQAEFSTAADMPVIHPEHRASNTAASAGVAGLVGGALIGAGFMATKKLGEGESKEEAK
jgi:hydrogenase small subunit